MEKQKKLDTIELSRAYLGVLVISILMATGIVSGMYSGESITFETKLTAPIYTITGNSSNLDGLSIEFENGNITIISDPLMASDNFTLIFFDEVTREVERIVYTGGGGGGSRTKYVDRNVTTYVPEYIDNSKDIVVEKVVQEEVIVETGYKLWHLIGLLILGIIVGGILIWLMIPTVDESYIKDEGYQHDNT